MKTILGTVIPVLLAMPALVGLWGCGSDGDDIDLAEVRAALALDCERAGGVISAQEAADAECARGVEGACVLAQGDASVVCDLPPSEGMCGDRVSTEELLLMLNGAVVAAGTQIEEGVGVYELFAGVLVGMLYNGIDWNQLDDLNIDFDAETGTYMLESGASRVGFHLSWARDFAGHSAGEPITDNVFALSSYVTGVDVEIGGSPLDPSIDYDYDEGPLFDLIDGHIQINGRDPRDLEIFMRLHADAIAIELDSMGRRRFDLPVPWSAGLITTHFDYETHIRSNRMAVTEVNDRLQGDGFALDMAQTVFERAYLFRDEPIYTTHDTFESTDFVLKSDEQGGFFEGEYLGTHAVRADVLGVVFEGALYHEGLLSNRQQNWTTFYCDAARSDLWGTALHDLDLQGGLFTFSSGRAFRYGSGELEWEEDQVED